MRELKSAEEIRAEIIRLVGDGILAKGGSNTTDVGHPMRHPQPDQNGCNWYISYFVKAGDHLAEVGSALSNVKGRWNLRD